MSLLMEKQISCKLRIIEYEQIRDIVEKNPDLYNDLSHFIRCSVIKQIRKYMEVG